MSQHYAGFERDVTKHPFHSFPVYLHHSVMPPIIAYNQADVDQAKAAGYSEEYQQGPGSPAHEAALAAAAPPVIEETEAPVDPPTDAPKPKRPAIFGGSK